MQAPPFRNTSEEPSFHAEHGYILAKSVFSRDEAVRIGIPIRLGQGQILE